MTHSPDACDPITLAVIDNGLISITSEMDAALVRTAFTPIISEAQDRANGIYSTEGEVIAQGPSSLPLFVSTMQDAVQSTIRRHPKLKEGDVVIVNDPYLVGTHMMDVRLIRPFYHSGNVEFYLANTGHWTDIGGMSPGSFCVTATEIQQEGVRIPPVRIVREGLLDEELTELILNNVRIPDNARGDLQAQISALDIGERRLGELIARYGIDTVRTATMELRYRADRAMRSHILEIPDGTYFGESLLDNDGITDDPIRVSLELTVEDDSIVCDFSGSSGWVRGPLNSTLPTTRAGVFIALKHLFPDVPTNAGAFDAVDFIVPSRTFLNATYPRAVSGCSAEVSSVAADAMFRALSSALPELVPAGSFRTMAAFTLGGIDPATGRPYVVYSFNGGGYGASVTEDGLPNAPLPIGIAQAPPVEVMEQRYPLLYERFGLREDSGGPGTFRGGLGVHYVIRLLRGSASSAALMNNGVFPPWGAAGGMDGAKTELEYQLAGKQFCPPLVTKIDGVEMHAGDRITIRTPGGGGYGDPAAREISAIRADHVDGYYSKAQLMADYGEDWLEPGG